MADRPPVTADDLMRVLADAFRAAGSRGFDEWLEREGVEDDAAVRVVTAICDWQEQFHALYPQFDRNRARILALFAFAAGWDAHRELRGEAPPLEL